MPSARYARTRRGIALDVLREALAACGHLRVEVPGAADDDVRAALDRARLRLRLLVVGLVLLRVRALPRVQRDAGPQPFRELLVDHPVALPRKDSRLLPGALPREDLGATARQPLTASGAAAPRRALDELGAIGANPRAHGVKGTDNPTKRKDGDPVAVDGGMARVARRFRLARATGVLALFAGGLLYLARPTDPAVFGWLDRSGLHVLAHLARALRHSVYAHVHLPAWFRGSASDVAYAFALGALLADAPITIVALGMVIVLGHEIAQGLGLAAGTFDPRDLVLLFVSFAFAQVALRPRHHLKRISS